MLQNLKFVQADAANLGFTNADVTGDAVDTNGASEVVFLLQVTSTTGVCDVFKIQGSDDGSTGWTDISGAVPTSLPGATDDNKNYAVFLDLRARPYRYLRFSISEDGTGTIAGNVIAILGGLNRAPETDAERGIASSVAIMP